MRYHWFDKSFRYSILDGRRFLVAAYLRLSKINKSCYRFVDLNSGVSFYTEIYLEGCDKLLFYYLTKQEVVKNVSG